MSPDKLNELPRRQRLGKTVKIFTESENLLCRAACTAGKQSSAAGISSAACINTAELLRLSTITEMLAADQLFSEEARAEFDKAAAVFKNATALNNNAVVNAAIDTEPNLSTTNSLRRALNSVRHLLLAEAGRSQADWDFTGSNGQLDSAGRHVFTGMQVYLEDIRSPFNVGSMFRSAESFGVEKIFLSPFCADPNHARSRRTAMGCVEIIPWERREFFAEPKDAPSIKEADGIEQEPLPVFAMETGGIPISEFPFPRRGLLIAGSEELGVSPHALSAAESSLGRVSIPCYGAKASLNVSVAFGIVMQAWAQAIRNEEL